MHRFIVAFLAAFDSVIAAAVGIAAVLAPLTLLWIFGFGGSAPWGVLWPAAVSVWQLGNLVPLHIRLPPEYLAVAGIGESEAAFLLSLAPLAFAGFTAVFAARSGARASRADAWMTGVVVGSLVFGGLTAGAALTARNPVAAVHLWQAVLFPTLVFAVPALLGAVVTEWREAGSGLIARVRDRIEAAPRGWGEVPGMVVRGSGVVLAGLIGVGALGVAVAIILGGGEVIALFEAANVDLVGVIVLALGQLVYIPTLVVWGVSYVAGPGFALGAGSSVSPGGTQLGIVPGVPILGILPEQQSPWMLLLALLPLALGAFAGWVVRSRLVAAAPSGEQTSPSGNRPWSAADAEGDHEPVSARLGIAVGIALVSAGGVALLSWVASGSLGPGRLADVGPAPGPVALAVGLEVLVGAAILLLSPRRRGSSPEVREADIDVFAAGPVASPNAFELPAAGDADTARVVPLVATTEPAPSEKPAKTQKPAEKPAKKQKPAEKQTPAKTPTPAKKPSAAKKSKPASAASAIAEPDAVTAPIQLPGTSERPSPPVD